jgi:hypothetical protein
MVCKISSVNHRNNTRTQNRLDGREAKKVMKQIANDVDQIKCLLSLNLISDDYRALRIPFRETIARDHSQMALPTRSIDEPKHCEWYSSQETGHLVFSRQYLSRMEVNRFASLGQRKTFVFVPFLPRYRDRLMASHNCSWIRKDRSQVCVTVCSRLFLSEVTDISCQFNGHPGY